MSEDQINVLIADAAVAIVSDDHPITVEISSLLGCIIISQLQLASRHPANQGNNKRQTERFARSLLEQIDPAHGEVYQILMHGFDPNFDVIPE